MERAVLMRWSILKANLSLLPGKVAGESSEGLSSPSHDLIFPLEIWLAIINLLADDPDPLAARNLIPLACICRALHTEVEAALYRRVTIGPDLARIKSFLLSVSQSPRRAAAVKALRVNIPMYRWEMQPPSLRQRHLASIMVRNYVEPRSRVRRVKSLPRSLENSMVQTFGLMTNITELDFYSLGGFPDVLSQAQFRLRNLRTEGGALDNLHAPTRSFKNSKHSQPSILPHPLETLSLDLHYSCPTMSCLCGYNVLHLTLDNLADKFVDDVRRAFPELPSLLSFRIVMGPTPSWASHRSPEGLFWPTGILASGSLPSLKRLEISQEQYIPSYPSPPSASSLSFSAHLGRIILICPNLRSFVWGLSPYHCRNARDAAHPQFGEALTSYITTMFARWRTLERFEHTRLEGINSPAEAEWVVHTRGADGSLVEVPCQYDEDDWKRAISGIAPR